MPRDSQEIFPTPTGEFPRFGREDDTPSGKIDFVQRRHLHRVTKASLTGEVDLGAENRLNELMKEELSEVRVLEAAGFAPRDILDIRQGHDYTREIKTLLVDLGIARMLIKGDWLVNRKYEIPSSLGVIPFDQLMDLISELHDTCCPYHSEDLNEDEDYKLMAVDLGCGNGEFCEVLRGDAESGKRIWEIFGYADCIYFTLNDFLKNLLKDEFQDDPVLLEFMDVIATLLIREIHHSNVSNKKQSFATESLLQLPFNVNHIRRILPRLDKHIKLRNKKKIKIDLEFLSDAEREISQECQRLIKEYLKSPDRFIDRYLQPEAKDLTASDKHRLRALEQEIEDIRKRDRRNSKRITQELRVQKGKTKIARRRRPGQITMQINDSLLTRQDEITRISDKIPDLSPFISLYHYNVIPSNFEKLGRIFPRSSVHFMWSFRATSHLDDDTYIEVLKNAAKHIAPGGVFLDDGKRETWSRFERIAALESIQRELGDQYRVRIITDGENTSAILLEKGVAQDDGEVLFFSDQYGREILKEGSDFVEVDNWQIKLPQILIKNRVIGTLRNIFAHSDTDGGRMHFKEAHSIIDEEVGRSIDPVHWQYFLEIEGGVTPDVMRSVDKVTKGILNKVKEKMPYLFEGRAVPLRENATIKTFARSDADGDSSNINEPRSFPITSLPRNLNVPTVEDLLLRCRDLLKGLKTLERATGKPPIDVIEFDDCFTNSLLVDVLHQILKEACFIYGVEFSDLVRVNNVKLSSGKYPNPEAGGPIKIIGGSNNSASGRYGGLFTVRYCAPVLEKIAKGDAVRVFGDCFGSQAVLQGLGVLMDKNFRTVRGALQFGAFPITFSDGHNSLLRELSGATCTVGMTREQYSLVEGYEELHEYIEPLAYELDFHDGKTSVAKDRPPPAFSLLGGKVVTTQFHPEISLSNPSKLEQLFKWLPRNHGYIRSNFEDPRIATKRAVSSPLNSQHYISRQFDIKARNQSGIVPWVANDIGPPFLINTLLNHVNTLLEQLHLKK